MALAFVMGQIFVAIGADIRRQTGGIFALVGG